MRFIALVCSFCVYYLPGRRDGFGCTKSSRKTEERDLRCRKANIFIRKLFFFFLLAFFYIAFGFRKLSERNNNQNSRRLPVEYAVPYCLYSVVFVLLALFYCWRAILLSLCWDAVSTLCPSLNCMLLTDECVLPQYFEQTQREGLHHGDVPQITMTTTCDGFLGFHLVCRAIPRLPFWISTLSLSFLSNR